MSTKLAFKIPSQFRSFLRCYTSKSAPSSSPWTYFSSKNEKKKITNQKPAKERCRKRRVDRQDPDLSRFGGKPYRTCGPAYIVQKDIIPKSECELSAEDKVLARIEADLSVKENVGDPMPPFRSVEQRLLDLTERKLHPFYKRYMSLPKNVQSEEPAISFVPYKCKSGPVEPEEVPDILKVNKELFEKKNIFADFKRVELPKQMVVRIVEMEKNKKPTLENKAKK